MHEDDTESKMLFKKKKFSKISIKPDILVNLLRGKLIKKELN